MAQRIESQVTDVQVVDRVTAYEATPGYSAQQSTLNTQRYFALLIGILVIGGFFQILTLQKVAQIGMLKAIGASNFVVVGPAAIIQIIAVTVIGVALGAALSLALSLGFPPTVPIIFSPARVSAADRLAAADRAHRRAGIRSLLAQGRAAHGAGPGAVREWRLTDVRSRNA